MYIAGTFTLDDAEDLGINSKDSKYTAWVAQLDFSNLDLTSNSSIMEQLHEQFKEFADE